MKRPHRRHGLRFHPLYSVWNGMMNRCHNPNDPNWENYGGRGIYVCKRWHRLENFIVDMSPRPNKLSLDRIDNNKNYSKDNCRWASRIEQSNNTRQNVLLEHNGEKLTLAEWGRKLGINRNTFKKRYRNGWEVSKIIETPVNTARATKGVRL